MPETIRRSRVLWTLMLVALGLAGCGGQSAQRSPASNAAVSPRASSAATASAATTASAAGTTVATAPARSERYAGIAQSKTAEGYYMLGDPTAPVVLTHYSDFL